VLPSALRGEFRHWRAWRRQLAAASLPGSAGQRAVSRATFLFAGAPNTLTGGRSIARHWSAMAFWISVSVGARSYGTPKTERRWRPPSTDAFTSQASRSSSSGITFACSSVSRT
jgi:hypothetical protein